VPAEHRAYNMATTYPVTKVQLRDAFVDAGFTVEPSPMAKRILTGALRAPVRVLGLDHDAVGPTIRKTVRQVLSRKIGQPLPNRTYDSTGANADLGWRGELDYRAAVRQAVEWARDQAATGTVASS
jgi:hypothetical protein